MASKYILIIGGKFIETDSVVSIKTSMEEEQWVECVAATIDAYMNLLIADKNVKLDKNDHKILGSLKKSVKSIKDIDPVTYMNMNVDKKIAELTNVANEEVKALKTIKIFEGDPNKADADVYVSKL